MKRGERIGIGVDWDTPAKRAVADADHAVFLPPLTAADGPSSTPQAGSLIRDTGIEPHRMTDGEVIPSE